MLYLRNINLQTVNGEVYLMLLSGEAAKQEELSTK